ncbi:MAG: DUF433 domain-containing protein [Spirochaetaceae bacterium]|nr:DUF433 domain-containing protein [Spirochaetaceae bacterium]
MAVRWRGGAVCRIVANPEILGGKPIVEGTRLSVEHILGLIAHGMPHSEIVESYPELSIDDLNIVVQYATDSLRDDGPVTDAPVKHDP